MLNGSGETALHLAVRNCKPDMVAALQLHQDIDVTVLNSAGDPASRVLPDAANHTKALISVRFFFSLTVNIYFSSKYVLAFIMGCTIVWCSCQ